MTFEEWAQVLVETAPFLFEPSSGTGGAGNNGGGTGKAGHVDLSKLPPGERLKHLHTVGATR
jgi:hypothetical protein